MEIKKLKISRWKEFPLMLKGRGVEIGTYKGKYAEVLCQLVPNIDLTVVDSWKVYGEYKDYEKNDLEVVAYNQALERSKKYGFKILKGTSMEVVGMFPDESLDFVFIDGNHDFRHVTDDVDEWSKKVKKGGIVSGHDFFVDHRHKFGVIEAIPGWCEANGIKELFVVANDKCPTWFFIKQ